MRWLEAGERFEFKSVLNLGGKNWEMESMACQLDIFKFESPTAIFVVNYLLHVELFELLLISSQNNLILILICPTYCLIFHLRNDNFNNYLETIYI